MSFAIAFARMGSDPQVRWELDGIDTHAVARRGQLWVCGGCSAPVQAVRSHRLRTGSRREAHFALRRPTGGGQAEHEETCRFDIRRVINEELVDLEHVRALGERFELVVAEQELHRGDVDDEAVYGPDRGPDDRAATAQGRRGVRRSLLGDVLRVVRLLNRYYDDPSAAKLFQALAVAAAQAREEGRGAQLGGVLLPA